ncbi:MAG: SUMF1/EgtB/PvdO family nonheme iron enzyme [Polyangiaceae bacterium]|nr:SUMF1/EgtB/PvdO family nonheme iron enzyme [Polyangiaceae bacterium]
MGSDVGEIAFAMTSCRVEPARAACNVSEDDFAMEFPPHTVTLSDFSIDRNEVTVGDYRRCVEAGPCGATPLASGGKRFEEPSLPATMVTWNDAVAYCKWRGGRLPTEAEWERAARGLTQRRYPWGNTYDPYLTNGGRFGLDFFEEKDGFLELAPVGSIPSGKTPDGLLDMAGNVEEWVSDWYGPYPEQSVADPKGPDSGDEKVVRGGGYVHGRAWLRAASRGHDPPGARRSWRGFRCAFDP